MRLYFSRIEQVAVAVLLILILAGLIILAYVYGRQQSVLADTRPLYEETTGPSGTTPATLPPTAAPALAGQLVVHVTGAVVKPGIYAFASGARVHDALRQAGGARAEGYPDALNLAAKLRDEQRIYVPTRAEWQRTIAAAPTPPVLVSTGSPPASPTPEVAPAVTDNLPESAIASAAVAPVRPAGKININTASVEELTTLPGVGPVTARRIIDYRTQHGKFTDLAQLLNVPRIGPKTLEKIKPYLVL